MNLFSKLFRSRDKPMNHLGGLSFLFGQTAAGKAVNERTAMQTTAVYACVRILAESIAGLPLHVYVYQRQGKERVPEHPLYFLLHDAPNSEMTSFVFRETLMAHLLLWGNAYAQILRDGRGRVLGLYPLLPDKMEVSRRIELQDICSTSRLQLTLNLGITADDYKSFLKTPLGDEEHGTKETIIHWKNRGFYMTTLQGCNTWGVSSREVA